MRLGEAMVKEGLITNEVLAKALERQIIFGGRLGTNLVEMGAVNEETLARFLGKMFGIPYAAPERFINVPPDVLESFPKELAVKHTSFPINRERNWLHLAMKDPNNIALLDELSFIVGLSIKPYIASEIRIGYALEKYYGVKRDLRYVAVAEEGGHQAKTEAPAKKPAGPAPAEKARPEEYLGDESLLDSYGAGMFGGGSHTEPFPVSSPHEFMEALTAQAPPQPQIQQAPVQQPAQAAPVQQAPVMQAPPVHPPAQPQPAAPVQAAPPPPPPVQAAPVQQAPAPSPPSVPAAAGPYEMLANPVDRDYVATAIVAAANQVVARAVLFMVKGGTINGWRGSGTGITDGMVEGLAVSLDKPTLFKEVVEDKVFYKGPILQIPENMQLMTAMGGVIPQEAVACPLVIRGKVMGVLYGDDGPGRMITGDIGRLESLMAKASMSLEILILKTKILADA